MTVKQNGAETDSQKQELFDLLTQYLARRKEELSILGGEDSPEYKREKRIILETIETYKLQTAPTPPPAPKPRQEKTPIDSPEESPVDFVPEHISCSNCGKENPAANNFCSECGTRLS